MKTVRFEPVNESLDVRTSSTLLEAIVAKDYKVLRACGGKGLCATCHVYIKDGANQVSPMGAREKRTLQMVTGCRDNSRLSCQCRVLGEGVVVELPDGMYIERAEDLNSWLGKRAEQDVLHPINASVLVAKGKIITRSRIEELKFLQAEVERVRAEQAQG